MEEMTRIMELKKQGFCCSQILILQGLEMQGKENPDLVRAMRALCNGIGGSGDVCGALTGGACVLGLYAGKGTSDEEDNFLLELMVADLIEWFKTEYGEPYGGIHCIEIVGEQGQHQSRCGGIVAGTIQKVKELLVENGFDLTGGDW